MIIDNLRLRNWVLVDDTPVRIEGLMLPEYGEADDFGSVYYLSKEGKASIPVDDIDDIPITIETLLSIPDSKITEDFGGVVKISLLIGASIFHVQYNKETQKFSIPPLITEVQFIRELQNIVFDKYNRHLNISFNV